jgi:rRNA maturation RNase YbeY
MTSEINFLYKDVEDFGISDSLKSWIFKVVDNLDYSISEINYTFMSDESLLQLNKDYLGHNYYTDIITFDNTIGKTISADIAISLERVKDNATGMNISFDLELRRVMIHGVLHCLGFGDKTQQQQQSMRLLENEMLNMFHVEHNNTH